MSENGQEDWDQVESDGVEIAKEERLWAMFTHLSALLGYSILLIDLPFGNVLGPLALWALKKDKMPFVNHQGKEALNFQLVLLLVLFICWLLKVVLIGFILAWAVVLMGVVLTIVAAINAYEGERYQYPFVPHLFK